MKRLLLLLTLACTTAFAAEPTLVVPPLSKPSANPAEGDPLQAKYDAAWTRFEEAIGKATAEVTKALDSQFEKAADAGNLELADMWDKKKKFFLDTKTLEWASDGKAKVEWRKTNPKVAFPEELSEVVASAQQAYAAAVDALKGDYEALVKEYTKARNLERAKQVREEIAALDQKPAAPPPRVRMVEQEKPALHPGRRGAVQFKGHSYKVFFEKLPWQEAKRKCEEMGGHLVIITDAKEEEFIHRLVADPRIPFGKPDGKSDGVWLGATDERQEGWWVWVNGDPMDYTNWKAGQPNNKNNEEHYAMLWFSERAWVDQPATSKQHDTYFICEWDE